MQHNLGVAARDGHVCVARRSVVTSSFVAAVLFASASATANILTSVNIDYKYQRYNNWCGSASVQMILSSPAVKNNNAFVSDFLMAPDDPGRPPFQPRLQPTLVPTPLGVNVSRNPQAFIYNLTHGLNTVNGASYLNPFLPYGQGSDTFGMAVALNLLDNSNFPSGVSTGTHAYTAWNFPATVAGAALATKAIANSLALTGVAAQAAIGNGVHSIVVNGVTTDVPIVPNTNYNVTGVIVSDPWTGFVDQQIRDGFPNPGGGRGFGFNAWLPSGYDVIPGAPLISVPGVGLVQGRFRPWLQHFNAAPANPFIDTHPVFALPGVQFITATASSTLNVNVPLEVGGPMGDFFGLLPRVVAPIPVANAAVAIAAAINLVPNNPALAPVFPLAGPQPGQFPVGNAVFLPDPNPIMPGDGDWLLPFLPFNATEFSGAVVIDALTGDIEYAIFSPLPELTYSFSDLNEIVSNLNNFIYPESGLQVPEPAAIGLLAPAVVVLARRRARPERTE